MPRALDDESAGIVTGQSDIRPVLAVLRDRGLLEEDDGCWSVPEALRAALPPDPEGVEPLRRKVVRDATAGVLEPDLHRLSAWWRAAWGLLTWAIDLTDDPDEHADLLQGLDHYAIWGGPRFDSRPYLERGAALLPADCQWWIQRRLAQAEIRHGAPPHAEHVHRQMESAIALSDVSELPAPLLARCSWIGLLIASGRFVRAIEVARHTADASRAARDRHYESQARSLEARALLWAGRLDEARDATRLARAVDPDPERPWYHVDKLAPVLASTGRAAEAITLLREAAARLKDAGRSGYAAALEAQAWWTAWASGEAERDDALQALSDACAQHPPRVDKLVLPLATIELAAGRLERAAGWLRRAPTALGTGAEVQAIGAALHASLGVPVRWDELPEASPEADPMLVRLADGFAHAAAGRRSEAREALEAVAHHPGLLFQALRPVLARLTGDRT